MKAVLAHSELLLAVALTVGLVLLWSPPVPARADDPDLAQKLADLDRRVQVIEKALALPARDQGRPTFEKRLSDLEEGLRGLNRAAGQPTWSSVTQNLQELQQTVRESKRLQEDLARRMQQLEREPRGTGRDGSELKPKLDELRRLIDDLSSRVRRLESRP